MKRALISSALVLELLLAAAARSQEARPNTSAYTTVSIEVAGNGIITPDYNQKPLRVGSYISPKPLPGRGSIFAGWSYGSNTCYACNVFRVEPGLQIRAHFIPDPFKALQGQFNGLIEDTNSAPHSHAGRFNLRIDAHGRIGGHISVPGISQSIADSYDRTLILSNDQAVGWIYPVLLSTGDPWNGDFRIVMLANFRLLFYGDPNRVTGTLSDTGYKPGGFVVPPTWTASLYGERARVFTRTNHCPQAGQYTWILPGGDGINQPGGHGFASISVSTAGRLSLTGYLADGSYLACSIALTQEGRWPLFVRLYGGRGALYGWMAFDDSGTNLGGTAVWARPDVRGVMIPATNLVETVGARYVRPVGSIFGFTNAQAVFDPPNADLSFTNSFIVFPNNQVRNTGTNRFALTLSSSRGLFSGSVKHPSLGKTTVFRGALLQNQDAGYGFFVSTNGLSGALWIMEQP
jgi:hypothetical protein